MCYHFVILSSFKENLEIFSNLLGICTPIVVFIWFIYSYRETSESKYYDELVGSYGGFFKSILEPIKGGNVQGGCILEIRSIDANGYFIGDLRIAEMESLPGASPFRINEIFRSEGNHTYLGKLNYRFNFWSKIHPYKPKENRIYKGKLWLTRLDFNVDNQDVDQFTSSEFKITHYRESRVMVLEAVSQAKYLRLPKRIQLNKTTGNSFDAYDNVQQHFRRVREIQGPR